MRDSAEPWSLRMLPNELLAVIPQGWVVGPEPPVMIVPVQKVAAGSLAVPLIVAVPSPLSLNVRPD